MDKYKEEYYLDEISRLLKNKECNFLAFAVTPLHATGVDAAICYLRSIGVEPNGYIYVVKHTVTGSHLNESNFISLDSKIRIVYGNLFFREHQSKFVYIIELFKRVKKLDNAKKLVYIVWKETIPWIAPILKKLGYEYKYIKIDDGGGSYVSLIKNNLQQALAYRTECKFFKKITAAIKSIANSVYTVRFEKKCKLNDRIVDFRLFRYINNTFSNNSLSVPYYVEAFKGQSIKNERDYSIFEDCILINTQCLKESNITDGIVDLELYQKVVSIIRKFNRKVVVKPHPRELDIQKYLDIGCTVYSDNTFSQEVILASLTKKPCCVISIFSSTLLNATGLFNIPAISLAKIMLQYNLNEDLYSQLNEFISQYSSVVFFPSSFDELADLISNLVGENYE